MKKTIIEKTIIAAAIGGFLLVFALAASVSPEEAKIYAKEAAVDEACDQMMADSALGAERRMSRQMCDGMKARLKDELRKLK
jgi:hypothetical protein